MKKGSDKLFFFIIFGITVLIAVAGLFWLSQKPTVSKGQLVSGDSYSKGNKEAKVQIVEFADFECPACAKAYPITKKIFEEYSDKINFVYRHFPIISIHQNALEAALAAEAAGEQGKFWQYHDLLFENQPNFSKDALLRYAQKLKLDLEKFKEALEKQKFRKKVFTDLQEGQKLGVDSTPTFFINGVMYKGVLDYEQFKKIIEDELSK